LPGKNTYRAFRSFVAPLNRALSCVTSAVVIGSGHNPENDRHALILNNGDPAPLRVSPRLYLTVAMHYRLVKHAHRREWKVSTVAYMYGVQDENQEELLGYHWHPRSTPEYAHPHLHLYEGSGAEVFSKRHLPTRRISLEELLRFLVVEMKVTPLKDDWEKILGETQRAHERFRTWS
jgi:hypothetical protein